MIRIGSAFFMSSKHVDFHLFFQIALVKRRIFDNFHLLFLNINNKCLKVSKIRIFEVRTYKWQYFQQN